MGTDRAHLAFLALLSILIVAILWALASVGTASTTVHAKALADHECDATEWHFAITGVTESTAPASITLSWGASTEVVALWKVTGGTAHYVTTAHLSDPATDATAVIADGWTGQFNLSHGPCPSPSAAALVPTPTPAPIPTSPPTPTPSPTPTPNPAGNVPGAGGQSPTPTPSPSPSPSPVVAGVEQPPSAGVAPIIETPTVPAPVVGGVIQPPSGEAPAIGRVTQPEDPGQFAPRSGDMGREPIGISGLPSTSTSPGTLADAPLLLFLCFGRGMRRMR